MIDLEALSIVIVVFVSWWATGTIYLKLKFGHQALRPTFKGAMLWPQMVFMLWWFKRKRRTSPPPPPGPPGT